MTLSLLAAGYAEAQGPAQLNLVPMPASVQLTGGASLRVDASFSVRLGGYREPRLYRAVQRFLNQLSCATALPISQPALPSAGKPALFIYTDHASKTIAEIGEDEWYDLEVSAEGARLNAATPLGAMHGLETFLQLVAVSPDGFTAPAVHIQDKPRFPWRGLMVDVCRHFIPLSVLKHNLDGMEAVKMNVFHWHLSENQGFRMESTKFPKLQRMGSDGRYYTQSEIRELVSYARDRGIRVVPEFDMPGHSTAWFVGYPELASAPGPYQIERRWGIFDAAMDPTDKKTYLFLDRFIGEVSKLFPDPFLHIGGDEVNGKQWDTNPKIQQFMRTHNLHSNHQLQAYFNTELQKLLSKHHKIMVGWDEILDPRLPKDIVIQSWRGQASLAEAAKQGYRGILSHGYYLDLGWSAAQHYAVDPISGPALALNAEEEQRILGGEACMWVEYVSAENLDSRVWPRAAAIAERLWSPQEVTEVASLYARLDVISARLGWLGLTHNSYYRSMLERIAGPSSPEEFAALRTLTDLVEPVKHHSRRATAPGEHLSTTPLNRMVDAVPLESAAARRFAELMNAFLAGGCRKQAEQTALGAQFTVWRDNDALFQSLARRSFLVQEGSALSQDLSVLGTMGLAALHFLEQGTVAPAQWKAEQLASMEQIKKPKGQLLLIPAEAVARLVEAVGPDGACTSKPAAVQGGIH
jgi:hexosaminidase